jgi:type I restriction enzyme, S subunit
MNLPKYAHYKCSEIPWMSETPSHWETVTLSRVTLDKCDGPFGSGIKSEHYTDEGALVIRLQNIRAGHFHRGGPVYLDQRYFDSELRGHEVLPGDILIAGLGDDNNLLGRACVAPDEIGSALVKADCFRFRVDPNRTSPKFVATQLSAGASFDAGTLSSGTTRSRIPLGTMATRRLALPPLVEQVAITTFLDRESAKIDALIAEQEKLLTLLAEKRQATISHAVTRGLDPDVSMKDSGIPWLGEVPAHWKVAKCGRFLSVLSGFAFPSVGFDQSGCGTRLLRGANVGVGALRWDDVAYWERMPSDGLDEYQLKVGDLVIGMDRPLISAGVRVARILESDLPCLLLQRVASLRTNTDLNAEFLMHYLSTPMFVAHFSPETTGVSVPHISPDQIASFVIAIPPATEQNSIVGHLEQELGKMELLQSNSRRAIELLNERRSALIAAAVTGKIDVRGAVEAKLA